MAKQAKQDRQAKQLLAVDQRLATLARRLERQRLAAQAARLEPETAPHGIAVGDRYRQASATADWRYGTAPATATVTDWQARSSRRSPFGHHEQPAMWVVGDKRWTCGPLFDKHTGEFIGDQTVTYDVAHVARVIDAPDA